MKASRALAAGAAAQALLRPSLCVVVHDVAAATLDTCERLIQAAGEVGPVPFTLLAVPRYHCAPSSSTFGQWLAHRADAGDEIALHGYTHQDEGEPHGVIDRLKRRVYTRGEGEFSDLTLTEATHRMTAGLRWLRDHRVVPRGFVAPAWLMSEGSWEALRWMPFGYTCTLRRLVLLPERRALTSQSVVYSCDSAWRRQLSLWWNAGVAVAVRRNPLLRLELHPHDVDHPRIRRSWQHVLEAHLADRFACTLGQVADHFRMQTDWDSLGQEILLDDEPVSHDHEHEAGREPTDEGADGHVARVMQAEHHA